MHTVTRQAAALATLHQRIARLGDAGGLGGRTLADATWEFHAACEGLAAVELRCLFPQEEGHRRWADTLGALVTGWGQVPPGAGPGAGGVPVS